VEHVTDDQVGDGVRQNHVRRGPPRVSRVLRALQSQKFTQPQIVTMLALRQFFKLDYRGTTERLREWEELRDSIELRSVPHFTTLIHAEKRLLKKMPSPRYST